MRKKKTGYSCARIYFNIYFCITYLMWFMTSYKIRRTFVLSKVRRRPKLRGVRLSPYLFARSRDFRVPVELHRYFGFLHWRSTYWNKMAHILIMSTCPANTNFNLIRSIYSKSNLAIESGAILLLLILSV